MKENKVVVEKEWQQFWRNGTVTAVTAAGETVTGVQLIL